MNTKRIVRPLLTRKPRPTLPRGLQWVGKLFNRLPRRWRQRGPYTIYFSGRELSAMKPIGQFIGQFIWYDVEKWATILPWKEPR